MELCVGLCIITVQLSHSLVATEAVCSFNLITTIDPSKDDNSSQLVAAQSTAGLGLARVEPMTGFSRDNDDTRPRHYRSRLRVSSLSQ